MTATNFNTKNDTFRKLIGNGLSYQIPRFQRDYSWTEDEWEDLWLDLMGTLQQGGETAHYMGYLVLQSEDDKTFEVIDGQQRLTTLSLIVLAVLKNLQRIIAAGNDATRNNQRLEQIQQTYVGYLDPVTLVSKTKLTLNRNNNGYYQTYLVPLGHLPQRGFRASEHALRKSFEWFDKHVSEYLKSIAPSDQGMALAKLVEDMSDRLFFTVITVTDELNAYKVFETLNARGVRLSATDLLKNYFFSVLHRTGQHDYELKALEDQWEGIVGRLGSESFPDFLRVHWNSRNPFARQAELFKTIRSQISDREAVFALLRGMQEDLDTYLALSSPEASSWPQEQKGHASALRTFNVKQPFPLIFAARRVFSEADFSALMRACVVISLRYNVIGSQPTHEQERVYNSVAVRVARKDLGTLAQLLGAMISIYPSDDAFKAAFAEKIIRTTQSRNGRVVRYVLCALEKQVSGNDHNFTSDSFNIEHVLPQSPQKGWDNFSEDEVDALVYRLGNMTLLQSGVNRDLGNVDYSVKRPVLQASGFSISQKIGNDNAEWTPQRLAAHQNWMANQAVGIWRIAQLS